MTNELIVYISLILSVISGGTILFFPGIAESKNLKLLLSFSGAYLLSVTFLHFVPEVYAHGGEVIGMYILIGFLFQLLLEYFSQGIEHGHIHVHSNHGHAFPAVLMISLCIHGFIEAIPLMSEFTGTEISNHDHHGRSLLMGIVFHNIPVSIALMSMFIKSHIPGSKSFFYLCLFAVMGPLGALFGDLFGNELNNTIDGFFNIVLAIVIGMFMHISTTILFESSEGHKVNFYKLIAILTGAAVAMINL